MLSEPSLIFTFSVPLVPLSTQIVPVATELGAELPMCDVFKAVKILFNSVRKELKP